MYDAAACFITGQKIRRDYSDGDPDWEENFYILSKTKCPAVLTENFFIKFTDNGLYLITDGESQNYYFSLFPSVCSHFTDTFSCQLNPVRRMYNTIHPGARVVKHTHLLVKRRAGVDKI